MVRLLLSLKIWSHQTLRCLPRTLPSRLSDYLDIDSLAQTVMCMARVFRPAGEWRVGLTTNPDRL
jgi:hypothetical protein